METQATSPVPSESKNSPHASEDEKDKPNPEVEKKTEEVSDSEKSSKKLRTTPKKINPTEEVTEEVLKRRADNRRHAAASRKRVKDLTDRLAKNVQELQHDIEMELQESAMLRRRMEHLTAENEHLQSTSVLNRRPFMNPYPSETQVGGGLRGYGLPQGNAFGYPMGLPGASLGSGLAGSMPAGGLPFDQGPGGMGLPSRLSSYDQFAGSSSGAGASNYSMLHRFGGNQAQVDLMEGQAASRSPSRGEYGMSRLNKDPASGSAQKKARKQL